MNTKDFNYYENLDNFFPQISGPGAFLLVNDENEKTNVMTVGWATVGMMWYKPVINIMVRKARYTHDLLERNNNFTICVPKLGDMKAALSICGSKSGRRIDKIEEAKLNIEKGRLDNTTILSDCALFYECSVIHKNEVNASKLDKNIISSFYGDNDFHTIYSGQIMYSYERLVVSR